MVTSGSRSSSQSSRGRTDITWAHVIEGVDPNGRKTLECLHCGKVTRGGGIFRMKQHLVGTKGDVGACLKVPFDVQYLIRESLKDIGIKNKEKADSSKYNTLYGAPVHGFEGDMLNEDSEEFRPSEIHINEDDKKDVQLLVDSYRKIWENVGCTLMADGWTDNSHRSLINFMVYCPKGVCFVKSIDASDVVKDVGTLLKMFEEVALWIRPNSIAHFVSDNGSNYKAVGRMLSEKYSSITWSLCAAHSINLVLKDIAEMDHIVYLARRASEGWKEIVHLGATRFATTFIAMRSLHEHKHDLQAMVTDRSCYKRISFNPIDYESIDKTEGWIVDDEEEVSELNYEELEQMFYGEGSISTGVADHPSFYNSTDGSEVLTSKHLIS
ncbi:uncharacterized protein LOC116130945 [Pistacia vera]|uniref:uncharacterized protein LOC116130945 n=1 Tax=Pistacia vera TaxID=55513 RepID=UPI00126301ED|nr:uncharacterized protein LOC116130945 [Pistacia vera]